ncbi:MAG: circadian clock protein KaiC [Planctomycetes bacterium]|nr:circadian clock protein KaiC [Planctomycetota bacterium]
MANRRSLALPSLLRKGPASILRKAATGVPGFDEITGGGLPKGRCSLICGSAGTGKTLFAMHFLVHAAKELNEPVVYFTFEETAEELAMNLASIGHDISSLVGKKKMLVEHVYLERSEVIDGGEYDLDGLFVRLGAAIDQIGAKRLVLDTLEVLFASLPNEAILRAEMRRLFRWLKDRGITTLITAERGQGTLTRYGIEEYVSDCVVLLDHRVLDEITTRRLRVVKYRGSSHATNEFPFLIDDRGFSVFPIGIGLDHGASSERRSTGIDRLDTMFGGKGYFKGSSVLISGTAGTGKSTLSAWFASAACRRGERCLYFAFEESRDQIVRNMRSIGNDLAPFLENGTLRILASRSSLHGLEMHLVTMANAIREFKPELVILDPISNFIAAGTTTEVKAMLTRLIDMLKHEEITGVFTSLTFGGSTLETTETTISSLMDTWMLVRTYEHDGERNRGLMILKSRGMRHSNQVREFIMNDSGIELVDVYLGSSGVLMGSARVDRGAREGQDQRGLTQEFEKRRRAIEHKRMATEAQIRVLQASLESDSAEMLQAQKASDERMADDDSTRLRIAAMRTADTPQSVRRKRRLARKASR